MNNNETIIEKNIPQNLPAKSTTKPVSKPIEYIYPRGVDGAYNKDKYIDPLLFDEAHHYLKNAEGISHVKIMHFHSDIVIATDKFAVTIKNVNGDTVYLFYAFGYDFKAECIEEAVKITHFINETDDVITRNGGNK